MYNGLEIDMLNLGDADSILVTNWVNNTPSRILVDGGRKKDAETVQAFLDSMGIKHLEHLVCSHIHDDHARGLVELVNNRKFSIGQAWLHIPSNHIDRQEMARVLNEAGNDGVKFARVIQASLQTRDNLQEALEARGINPQEPFKDCLIGDFVVCSPTIDFYREKLKFFSDYDKLLEKQKLISEQELRTGVMDMVAKAASKESGLLDNPVTDPENETSVVLGTAYGEDRYLLTADAGVESLTQVKDAYGDLGNLRFMQIPHHGSRHNITKSLIEYFAPQTAFVSAEGNGDHPRRAVVNAFNRAGSKVYSTHYRTPQNIWHHNGNVPTRSGYSSLQPLSYD